MRKPVDYALGVVLIFLYHLPHIILGENSYLVINDLLDGSFIYKVLLANYSDFFQTDKYIVKEIMNGVPIGTLGSELNIVTFIFKVLPPFTAYIVNDFIVRFVAYIGMLLLLRRYILAPELKHSRTIAIVISALFSLAPFFSIYGIMSAGIPLVLYAFLNLHKNRHVIQSYLIIVFFALYSNFIISGLFVIGFLSVLYIFLSRRTAFNIKYVWGLVLLTASYVLFEHLFFEEILFGADEVSHRTLWGSKPTPLKKVLFETIEVFVTNQHHAGKFFIFPIIPALLLLFVLNLRHREKYNKIFIYAFSSVMGITALVFLMRILSPYVGKAIPFLRPLQLDRFYMLLPAAWMILFAVLLQELIKKRLSIIIIALLLLCQGAFMLYHDRPYLHTVMTMAGVKIKKPSFAQYYSAGDFAAIEKYINKDKSSYKVGSIGMHPVVPLANGFHTIDAYLSSYPLSYKLEFRKIIEKELEKDSHIRKYFDTWGNRCYLFSSELSTLSIYGKYDKKVLNNLELDAAQLKKLGCQYIISSVAIMNPDRTNLKHLKTFTNPASYRDLYLYEVM